MKKTIFSISLLAVLLFSAAGCKGGKDDGTNTTAKPVITPENCTHSFASEVVPPSCAEGYTMHTCTLCGYSYSDTYTEATGHKYIESYIDSDCNKTQTLKKVCSECKYVQTEPSDIAGTIHDLEKIKVVYPTRYEGGYSLYRCSNCDKEETKDITEPRNHSVGLEYKDEFVDGKYVCYVRGIGTCTDKDIVIPSVNEYGQKVCVITEWAFYNQTHITSVSVPAEITIMQNAFNGCSGIINLDIAEKCTIEAGAFCNMASLQSLALPMSMNLERYFSLSSANAYPEGLETIYVISISNGANMQGCTTVKNLIIGENVSVIPSYFAYECTALENITLHDGIKEIKMSAFCCTAITEFTVPRALTYVPTGLLSDCKNLTKVDLHDNITSIESFAFNGCSSLKEITLPPRLVSIGEYAFAGTGITEITVPESVTNINFAAFAKAAELSKINLHTGITGIEGYAFSGTAIESFTFHENVTEFGDALFKDCTKLTSVTFNGNIKAIPMSMFSGCTALASITIPEGIKEIGGEAFYGCTSLESIIIPSGVKEIGFGAFGGCVKLTSIELPAGVTTVAIRLFENCTSLESVILAPGTTEISEKAFLGCTSLKEIALPETLRTIGYYSFSGSGILEIELLASISDVSAGAFSGCASLGKAVVGTSGLGEKIFENCTSLEEVIFEEGVSIIPRGMFEGCASLTKVTFASSVKSIESSAFGYCTGLTELTVPVGVVSVDRDAFIGCSGIKTLNWNAERVTSSSTFANITTLNIGENVKYIPYYLCQNNKVLQSVNIPEGVEEIGCYAFAGCSALENVNFPASLTGIHEYAFSETALNAITFTGEGELTLSEGAFYGCADLASVDFASRAVRTSADTFVGCEKLGTLKGTDNLFVNSAKDFPERLYTKQNSLLILANTLVSYDEATIEGKVTIPEGIRFISPSAFEGSAVIHTVSFPKSLVYIGNAAFKDCTRLSGVIFSEEGSALKLEPSVFEGCTALEAITFPDYVTEIPMRTLFGCTALTHIGLPATLEFIDENFYNVYYAGSYEERTLYSASFGGTKEQWRALGLTKDNVLKTCTVACTDGDITAVMYYYNDEYSNLYYIVDTNFTMTIYGTYVPQKDGVMLYDDVLFGRIRELVIAEGVREVDLSIFASSASIENVVLPSTMENIDIEMLANTPWYKNAEMYDENGFYIAGDVLYKVKPDLSGAITLPEGIRHISKAAFKSCERITSVVIPEGVVSIGENAFCECDLLESVTLPATLKKLGGYAFSACPRLQNVTLPEGVEVLGSVLFSNCDGITEITVPSTVTEYGKLADSCESLTKITVKSGESPEAGLSSHCYGMEYVIFEGGVTHLPNYLVGTQSRMKAIVISSTVTRIERYAFYFGSGTALCFMSESNAKDITDYANEYSADGEFTYYIYSENPTTEGNFWHYDENGNPYYKGI